MARQKQKSPSRIKTALFLLAFALYILLILHLTIFRFSFHYNERQLNVALFSGLINTWYTAGVWEFLRLFLGNIGFFVPFGFALPLLAKQNGFARTVLFGFLFSLFIEITQYISYKGVAELDDLILNTFGVALGYLCFLMARKVAPNLFRQFRL